MHYTRMILSWKQGLLLISSVYKHSMYLACRLIKNIMRKCSEMLMHDMFFIVHVYIYIDYLELELEDTLHADVIQPEFQIR